VIVMWNFVYVSYIFGSKEFVCMIHNSPIPYKEVTYVAKDSLR